MPLELLPCAIAPFYWRAFIGPNRHMREGKSEIPRNMAMINECISVVCVLGIMSIGLLMILGIVTVEQLKNGIARAFLAAVAVLMAFCLLHGILVTVGHAIRESLTWAATWLPVIVLVVILLMTIARTLIARFAGRPAGRNQRDER